ncbi:MAG: hypothetical protein AAGF12_20850 [Myxococcota bacterium]
MVDQWTIRRDELERRILARGDANRLRTSLTAIYEAHGPMPDEMVLDEALTLLEHLATIRSYAIRARFLRAELILDSVRQHEDP